MKPARSAFLQALAQRIQEIETPANSHQQPSFSSGIAPLDELLPDGCLPSGSLVELLSAAEGAGAGMLALLMAKHACGEGKVLVVVDDRRCFYPPAAAQWGIDLDRSLVIRPRNRRDALLATNQSLRCSAVGAVVAGYDELPSSEARRFQLAAEAGGGLGFLLRPRSARRAPSFAYLRLWIAPLPSARAGRRLRVEIVRCRGGKAGSSVRLEISDETGHVRLLPELASSEAPARAARTSG